MGLKEGSVIPINLRCGCKQTTVVVLHGTQRIRCTECGKTTKVDIRINDDDEVSLLETTYN